MREVSSDDFIRRLRLTAEIKDAIAAQRTVRCQPQCKKNGSMPSVITAMAALLS